MQRFTSCPEACKFAACISPHSVFPTHGLLVASAGTDINQLLYSMTSALALTGQGVLSFWTLFEGPMSGKSRRGKKRRRDDGLAEYRTYGKDPLYADYCKQVITLVKKGRQKDLPDELLASCSPAAIITAMLELSEYRCASWHEGCPMYAPKLDRRATLEGVEVSPVIAGKCPMRKPLLCLKDLLLRLGYTESLATELN